MEKVVVKKYVDALLSEVKTEEFDKYYQVLSGMAQVFDNSKSKLLFTTDIITKEEQEAILLDTVKSVDDKRLNNFLKILLEKKRVLLIPFIAEEIRLRIANANNKYSGKIYSSEPVAPTDIDKIAKGLSTDKQISLSFEKNDFDGIKIVVEDLNLEVTLSKDRIKSALVEHVLKAI
jgi:F-type H+-transporting ATPase subunit delta